MTAKNRITINLNDKEYQALQKIAEQNDRSLSWLGRKAVCDFIQKREQSLESSLASTDLNNSNKEQYAQ